MSEFSQFKSTPSSSPIDVKDAAARWQLQSTQTATGNPLTLTDCAPINAESLVVELEPKQDLHGQDAPYVGGAGYNKWDEEWEVGDIDNDGQPKSSSTLLRTKNFNPCQPSTTYYVKCPTGISIYFKYYDSGKNFINPTVSPVNNTITTPSNCAYYKFVIGSAYGTTYNHDIAINYPSSITTYSPWQNICPITGYTQTSVGRCGKNLWNGKFVGISLTSESDTFYPDTYAYAGNVAMPIEEGETYTFSINGVATTMRYVFLDKDQTYIGSLTNANTTSVAPSNAKYLCWRSGGTLTTGTEKCQIEKGNQATTYEPYSSTSATIQFGQTVYGGVSDFVEGGTDDEFENLDDFTDVAFHANQGGTYAYEVYIGTPNKKYGVDNLIANEMSVKTSFTDVAEFSIRGFGNDSDIAIKFPKSIVNTPELAKQWCIDNGLQIVYEKATSTTISTPPTDLKLLKGTNNLSADGVMQIGYQPDNVVGELKGEIETITEMDYLRILDNNVDTPINNYRIYYHLISGAYTLVNMGEMLQHRFIFVEVIKNPSGGVNKKVLHSALIDPRTIDGFEYEMKASGNDIIWIESILDENKFSLSLRTTGGSYSDGDPTDYYVTIRMVD